MTNYMLYTGNSFQIQYIGQLEVKGWKKIHQGNTNFKKARMAISVSDNLDFRAKKITREKRDTT